MTGFSEAPAAPAVAIRQVGFHREPATAASLSIALTSEPFSLRSLPANRPTEVS
jgi:hypothetical protein